MTIQIKATEQYFLVVLYALLNKLVLNFNFHQKIPDQVLSVRRNNLQYQRSCDWPPGGQTLGKGQVLEMGIDTPVDCDVCPTEYQRKKYRHGLQDQRGFPVDHARMFSNQFTFLT